MKTISKLAPIISLLIVLGMAIPTGALTVKQTTVCSRVSTLKTSTEFAIQDKLNAMTTDFATRLENISKRQSDVGANVASARATAKTNFENKVIALRSQSDWSNDQLAAIDTYQASVEQIEKIREAKVDTARDLYLTQLEQTVTIHQDNLTAAATTFLKEVDGAFNNADLTCSSSASTTLATLRQTVKSSRLAFSSTRVADKVAAQIKQFASQRNASIQQDNQDFRTAAQGYRQNLLSHLQKTSVVPL